MKRNFHSAFANIVNYINVPPFLYRYENQEHIERFFETGEIMLSSFRQYSSYADNELGDRSEGQTINFGNTTNDKTICTVTGVGHTAYCFCTSTTLDDGLKSVFKRDGVFRITDPMNFMIEIQRSLARVREVLFGNCIYLERKSIVKNIPAIELEDMRVDGENSSISFDKMMAAMAPLHGPEQFFLKKSQYQKQAEYRILWITDQAVSDPLIMTCPEAAKSCEKVQSP